MTRWTFYLITNDKLIGSTEFNWWMYPEENEWRWGLALRILEKINSKEDFTKAMTEFNQVFYGYPEELVYEYPLSMVENNTNFNHWYFDFRFSDYIFIKNLSDKTYTFTLKDKKKRKIKVVPWDIVRFNFWEIHSLDEQKYKEKILTSASL